MADKAGKETSTERRKRKEEERPRKGSDQKKKEAEEAERIGITAGGKRTAGKDSEKAKKTGSGDLYRAGLRRAVRFPHPLRTRR